LPLQADSYANNKGLCGGPLEPCKTQKRRRKFDFSFKSGFLVGYVFSVVLVIPIFMSHYVACMNGKQRGKKMALSKGSSTKKENFEADQLNHLPTKELLQEESKKVLSLTLLKSKIKKLLSIPLCYLFYLQFINPLRF
jgi:hypothetical protein